jgi:two-component system response regulator MprA
MSVRPSSLLRPSPHSGSGVMRVLDGADARARIRWLDDLVARIRVLLRRERRDALRFGDLRLDPATREVRRGRRAIVLTPIEFSLLELFLRNPRRVLTRSFIFTYVWGFDFGGMSNSLNVYVGNLRRKTEAGGEPRLIHTVRGVGYVLREPA